jgi:hypothetical protein
MDDPAAARVPGEDRPMPSKVATVLVAAAA